MTAFAGLEAVAAPIDSGAAGGAGSDGSALLDPGTATEDDGSPYRVSSFAIRYYKDHSDLPQAQEVLNLAVELGKTEDGYVAWREGLPKVTLKLDKVASIPDAERLPFYASAIRIINEQIVVFFNRRNLIGIYVDITDEDRDENQEAAGEDGFAPLRLTIWSGVVSRLRTLASGDRLLAESKLGDRLRRLLGVPIPTRKRVDNPAHEIIRRSSPVQPGDLLRKDLLDDYVFLLNRHPNRRVDVSLASGGKPGQVALDYMVTENRPLLGYYQLSNTGTEATGEWRSRFGLLHQQLTGHDDVLSLDYMTVGFGGTSALLGSYEVPLVWNRVRARVFGSINEFTASDVGLANERFNGDGWFAGADLIANVFQYHDFFVDAVIGVRWENIQVDNEAVNVKGEADMLEPHAGFRFERISRTSTTQGQVDLEWTLPRVGATKSDQLTRLGRLFPDDEWRRIRWEISHSFYLEPLLFPDAWKDTDTHWSSTLAHEMAFVFRGQTALGSRVIPQHMEVVGGLYSVRGYSESIVAGDNVWIGSAEYRLHLARLLKVQPDPAKTPLPILGTPFRFAPQQPHGRADWDVILRAFYDVGQTRNNHKLAIESDDRLRGAGLGVEIQYKRNMSLRFDWGQALRGIDNTDDDAGDNRFHFVFTFLY